MSDSKKQNLLVLCKCSYWNRVDVDVLAAVGDWISSSGHTYLTLDDFCQVAAADGEYLEKLADKYELTIIACHSRSVRCLLDYAGLDSSKIRLVDIRSAAAEAAIERLSQLEPAAVSDSLPQPQADNEALRWYPVVDYSRCVSCGQCLNFCLFGVYKAVENVVRVVNPAGCKNDCPACARLCPRQAIVFPKHPDPPINGLEVSGVGQVSAEVKIDPTADLHAFLRNRSAAAAAKVALNRDNIESLAARYGIPKEITDELSAKMDTTPNDTQEKTVD